MRWLKLLIGFVVGLLFGWLIAHFFWNRRQAASEEAVFELRPTPREQSAATMVEDVSEDGEPQTAKTVEQEPVGRDEIEDGENGDEPDDDVRSAVVDIVEVSVDEAVEPDDLRRIEGIGPKISDILNENGIYTFAQLASTDANGLRSILTDAGPRFRLANPVTWPQQAQVAAAGDWDGLLALQVSLKHGR